MDHSDSDSEEDTFKCSRDTDSSDSDSDDNLMVSQELRPGFSDGDVRAKPEENNNTSPNAAMQSTKSDSKKANSNMTNK